MAPLHDFEHLPLLIRDRGPARFPPGFGTENPVTASNKSGRVAHTGTLRTHASSVSAGWEAKQEQRARAGLPAIIGGIPLLLRIDTSLELDDLRRQFGFEIISEEDDGYIIAASEDVDLVAFQQKLTDFAASAAGSSNVARIHELREDLTQEERLRLILSDVLFQQWPSLSDDDVYICDVSVTCVGDWEVPTKPSRNPRWKDETWARKENEWSTARVHVYERWEALKDQRLDSLRTIVRHYKAEILKNTDSVGYEALILPDSFTVRLKIIGKGLKDLVLNYAYIFEVTEPDDIETPQRVKRELLAAKARVSISAPPANAPVVCVIDSGIQEEHVWLEPGIDKETSWCFLSGASTTDVADYVEPSGHGTRVAGAVLYGEEVPKTGTVSLETWVQNARVLDGDCSMPMEMIPAEVMRRVVTHFHEGRRRTRIFNHSINAASPCRTRHMSAWAAEIDLLCNDNDVLVIQSSGNLRRTNPAPMIGIAEHLSAGRIYPEYFGEDSCRVANPSQSLQALTVGSVAYGAFEGTAWRSLASENGHPSAFERVGLGIWGSVKPEVVEYGGDCLVNGNTPPDVGTPPEGRDCYPELVRSTKSGGPAFDRDEVGTSFSAPKVTRIAARLQSVLPDATCLLYRALIVQSAHWPQWALSLPRPEQANVFRRIGYGVPDISRATENTEFRTTFITHSDQTLGAGDCHVYEVPVPADLRRPGDDYLIRIDVTLSYAAPPRRTRQKQRGYLATWLDWTSNRKGESIEAFLSRALKSDEDALSEGAGSLGWTVHEQPQWGLPGVTRRAGTVQKDWAYVRSNALPEDLCIAVRGHRGWSKDPDSVARYSLAVTLEIVGREIPIYDSLRTAVLELQAELQSEIEAEVEVTN